MFFYPVAFRCIWTMKTSRVGKNGNLFADDILNKNFFKEPVRLRFHRSFSWHSNNKTALVYVRVLRRAGDKPLPKPMVTNSLTVMRHWRHRESDSGEWQFQQIHHMTKSGWFYKLKSYGKNVNATYRVMEFSCTPIYVTWNFMSSLWP